MNVYLATPMDTPFVVSDPLLSRRFRLGIRAHGNCLLVDTPARADMIILLEWIGTKSPPLLRQLCDDPFIRKHSDRLFTINGDDQPVVLFPGLYVSLQQWQLSLRNDIRSSCYWTTGATAAETLDFDGRQERIFDAYFRGYPTHPCRRELAKIHESTHGGICCELTDGRNYSGREKTDYLQDIAHSYYALCPRGAGTASIRLFETMALGIAPIIIGDDWVPFGDWNWDDFSFRVPESEIERIPQLVRDTRDQAIERGRLARDVYRRHLSSEQQIAFFLDELIAIALSGHFCQPLGLLSRQPFLHRHGCGILNRLQRKAMSLARQFINRNNTSGLAR